MRFEFVDSQVDPPADVTPRAWRPGGRPPDRLDERGGSGCGTNKALTRKVGARHRGGGVPARFLAGSIRLAIVLTVLVAVHSAARAAPDPDAGPDTQTDGEEWVPEDSPRASVSRFVELCRDGKWAEAAAYLDLPPARKAGAPELAWRLQAVLDRHAWIDLDRISALPEGNPGDELPTGIDEIATIAGPSGRPEPVRLVRRRVDAGVRWLFSRATVNRIDVWYSRLEHRWVLEHLPDRLLQPGPGGLVYWQWLALPILLSAALVVGLLLSRLTRRLLARLVMHTSGPWQGELVARIGPPLTLAWALLFMYLVVPALGLYEPADDFVHRGLRAGLFVVSFWILLRSVDVARQLIAATPWVRDHAKARPLLPLAARVAKVLLAGIGAVALLSELGYPVASLLAGLGIGGLAVALAAQKSLENLFGAFSLGADQPFREGDFVKVEEFVGTVERIGLRSTKIRTLDRTIITIPNGKLAEMRLESFSARDRMRLACVIRLVHGTSTARMREVLAELERVLREHPKIWPDAVIVRFAELGEYSLNIEVMAWFQTPDWDEFQLIRQEVLLQFVGVVEKAGCSIASPTPTVHLVSETEKGPTV